MAFIVKINNLRWIAINNESFANKLKHYKVNEFVLTKELADKIESSIHGDYKLINFQNKYFKVEESSQIECIIYWMQGLILYIMLKILAVSHGMNTLCIFLVYGTLLSLILNGIMLLFI